MAGDAFYTSSKWKSTRTKVLKRDDHTCTFCGFKAMKGMQVDEGAFSQVEAIIRSMTRQERVQPKILNGSRRKRIARGSGTTVQDVNQLVKQFQMMQKMMKQMGRAKGGRMKMKMPFAG